MCTIYEDDYYVVEHIVDSVADENYLKVSARCLEPKGDCVVPLLYLGFLEDSYDFVLHLINKIKEK